MVSKKDFIKIHPVKSAASAATKSQFNRINEYLWEIPKSFRKDMLVSARIYASQALLDSVEETAITQLINCAVLPGIIKYSIAMPDIHSGYGPPIGAVGAMNIDSGVISPCFVGFDENCGVRLLKSDYNYEEIKPYIEKLASEIQKQVPSGLGQTRETKMSIKQIDEILEKGVPCLVEKGFGDEEDIENCESRGKISEADASLVSDLAKKRGKDEVGTLGSGNHFCEIQKVEEVFDDKTAEIFGLFKNQVVVMIHTGSRALGHQNCTDYWKLANKVMEKYSIKVPDKELAYFPFQSSEGQKFFKALNAASNYAFANRQMISFFIRKAWQNVLQKSVNLRLLYDVAHNIAKVEEHIVNGEKVKLIVHRKGATRAFPPGHPEIPAKYRETGQPIIFPGNMGDGSYILTGTENGKDAWFSTSHGAGRTMSRHEAMRRTSGQEVIRRLKEKGILIKCRSIKGIAEEAPLAYKNVEEIVDVVHHAGLSRKVVRLVPLAVIKGE